MDQHSADVGSPSPNDLLVAIGPLGNDWSLGLATAEVFDAETAAHLRALLECSEPEREAIDGYLLRVVTALEAANTNYFRFELVGAIAPGEPTEVTLDSGLTTSDLRLGLIPGEPRRKLIALITVAVSGDSVELVNQQSGRATTVRPGHVVVTPAYCSLTLPTDDASATFLACHAFGPAFR